LRLTGKGTVKQLERLSHTLQGKCGLPMPPMIQAAAGFVNLDVPKEELDAVDWQTLHEHAAVQEMIHQPLHVPIGVDTDNIPLMFDLEDASTAHMLLAGSSDSGKSELLKAIAASLISKPNADQLALTLVDPKQSTFQAFRGIPQLEGEVWARDAAAVEALEALAQEMDRRYTTMAQAQVESMAEVFAALGEPPPQNVVIIDELSDFALGLPRPLGKRFESALERLVQKGHAAGIHLILATQNPVKRVLSNLIKANLPVKVCLRVVNTGHAMNVLKQTGAERLAGRGDFLVSSHRGMERGQAPLLADETLRSLLTTLR